MPLPADLFLQYLAKRPVKTVEKGRSIFQRLRKLQNDFDPLRASAPPAYYELRQEGPRSASVDVPSQTYDFNYTVKLSWSKIKVTGKCECAAFLDKGFCKHIVQAICYLEHEAESETKRQGKEDDDTVARAPENQQAPAAVEAPAAPVAAPEPSLFYEKKRYDSPPSTIFRTIDYRIAYHNITQAELRKVTQLHSKPEGGIWNFSYKQTPTVFYYSRITYNHDTDFRLSCSCSPETLLCSHLYAAACTMIIKEGANYFVQFRDYTEQKARQLKELGLQPGDPEAADVKFSVDAWGEIHCVPPAWLWSAKSVDAKITKLQQQLGLRIPDQVSATIDTLVQSQLKPAVVFQASSNVLPFHFEISIANIAGGKFSKLNINNSERLAELKVAVPRMVFNAISALTHLQINAALKAAGVYQTIPSNVQHLSRGDRGYQVVHELYANSLRKLWPWLVKDTEVFISDEARVSSHAQDNRAKLHASPVTGAIRVEPAGKFILLRLQFQEAGSDAPVDAVVKNIGGLLLRSGDTWYLPADDKTEQLTQQFPEGYVRIPVASKRDIISKLIPSLRSEYKVIVDPGLEMDTLHPTPVPSLHLMEHGGKNLVLVPRFGYEQHQVLFEDEPLPILHEREDGTMLEIIRDASAEKTFAERVRSLHPSFADRHTLQSFVIPFGEALKESWYQKMLAAFAEEGIEVTGLDALLHFRYSPHEAKVTVTEAPAEETGIDWFDLLIEVSFGEQQVSLKDVRKALLNGQAGVRLNDGTIGLLSDDFIEEYGVLLRLGSENKTGGLRVNKLHFTLVDALHEAALGKDMRAEIAARKAALKDIENIKTTDVPDGIQATLRPYQAGGYSWLQLLYKLGWGACLADDMGLGKTLQVITFLQFLKNTEPEGRHLVVCPTSLIYNWEAELLKFAPELRYHIHYGLGRSWDAAVLKDAELVITSYGIMRSDLAMLAEVHWTYVILDESQAIKNPDAQTTKAAQALNARNRICMSGTPLQNNTYDLYAQFQFLNPGLLGSRDVFRTEFANPIDKNGDPSARTTLRRMLAPFMLRRTKEQVARDLPDKTEVTLWCEMDSQQRAVYDEYRRYYRDSLLQRIDDDGMEVSAIYVLEALLRLRQLCDHPALVKNSAVKTTESIKLDELRREIRENAGGRKVLVFSQFTEMLALIKKALEDEGIVYAYLDGKTPAAKRKEAVNRFQEDASVQVFLISLKAGGVGLNLTAAEYVYIVDPWWNPAAEAQAIDRTHRIGQTNKIVAYRMICKDTVEEKVMMLQNRKRALAEGLVTEDAGFVKKLTREDVAFLLE